MQWLNNLLGRAPASQDTALYPSRRYKKVLCSRNHCDEACQSRYSDPWRFWTLFLSSKKPDRAFLFANIASMPCPIRYSIYFKCFKPKRFKMRSKPTQEDHDSPIAKEIIDRSFALKYQHPRKVFLIFKTLSADFPVDRSTVELIFKLLSLDGASTKGVYSILHGLFYYHGLSDSIGSYEDPNDLLKTMNNPIVSSGQSGSLNNDSGSSTSPDNDNKPNEGCNSGSTTPSHASDIKDLLNGRAIANNASKEQGEHSNCKESVSEECMREIWRIIVRERLDVFIFMTDLVVSLRCTYRELINKAANFSKFTMPGHIVGVLAGKRNTKYYAGEYKQRSNKTTKKKKNKETYFDFLVVQQELIKAQESMKEELHERIRLLEDENIKLKMENREIQNELLIANNKEH